MLVSQISPVVSYETLSRLAKKNEIADGSVSEKATENKKTKWYSRRVKEAIHIRLYPNNINRDSGIEIPEAWMPTVRQHDNRYPPKRTAEGTVSSSDNINNGLDRTHRP